jgi:hypothetical protein
MEVPYKKAFGHTFQGIKWTRRKHKHLTQTGDAAADDNDLNLLL